MTTPSLGAVPVEIEVTATQTGGAAEQAGMLMRILVLDNCASFTTQETSAVAAVSGVTTATQDFNQGYITPTTPGSVIYGAAFGYKNGSYTVDAASTEIDNVADTVHSCQYMTAQSSAPTPATPKQIIFGWATSPTISGGIAMCEILPATNVFTAQPMTITADASSPDLAESDTSIDITTVSFSPPPGSLLVALVSSNSSGTATGNTVQVTSSVVGVNAATTTAPIWTEAIAGNTAGCGYAGVWVSYIPVGAVPIAAGTYPGPPAGLHTWSLTTPEVITVPILRNDVTAAAWWLSAPPLYSGQQAIYPQQISSGSDQVVYLDTTIDDPLNEGSEADGAGVFGAYSGWYLAFGMVSYDAASASADFCAAIGVQHFGNITVSHGQTCPSNASYITLLIVCDLQPLNTYASDNMALWAYEDAGTVSTYVYGLSTSQLYGPQNSLAPTFSMLYAARNKPPTGWTAALPVPANTPFSDTTEVTGAFMNAAIRDTVNFLQYPPVCRLQLTTTVQIASTTFPAGTAVTFSTAQVNGQNSDTYAGWNGTTRYTFPVAGLYYVYGQVAFLNNTTGTDRAAGLRVSAGTIQWGSTEASANDSTGHVSVAVQMIRVTAGQYVELIGYSNATTGGGISIGGNGESNTTLIVMWVAK